MGYSIATTVVNSINVHPVGIALGQVLQVQMFWAKAHS